MARSKSPARGRKRAAKAAKSTSADIGLDDANVISAISAVSMIAYLVISGHAINKDLVGSFFNLGANDVHVKGWPWGLVITGHVLHNCANSGGGHWVAGIWNSLCSCFAALFVLDFLSSSPWSLLADEKLATLVGVCWYLQNHNLPFTKINIWSLITGSPVGALIQFWCAGCSKVYIAGLILEGVNAASNSTAGPLGFSFYSPVLTAVMVGAAGSFWPLSQNPASGFKCSSAAAKHALNIVLFTMAMAQISKIFAGTPVTDVVSTVEALVGGNLVMAIVSADHLLGDNADLWAPFNMAVDAVTGVLNL